MESTSAQAISTLFDVMREGVHAGITQINRTEVSNGLSQITLISRIVGLFEEFAESAFSIGSTFNSLPTVADFHLLDEWIENVDKSIINYKQVLDGLLSTNTPQDEKLLMNIELLSKWFDLFDRYAKLFRRSSSFHDEPEMQDELVKSCVHLLKQTPNIVRRYFVSYVGDGDSYFKIFKIFKQEAISDSEYENDDDDDE